MARRPRHSFGQSSISLRKDQPGSRHHCNRLECFQPLRIRHHGVPTGPTRVTYLIDGRPLQSSSAVRGIGSYLRGLLAGFNEIGMSSSVSLLLSKGQATPAEVNQFSLQISKVRMPQLHPTLQPSLDLVLIERALRRDQPDVYHAVEWGQPLRALTPVVVTVHDLIPFIFPRQYPWVRRARVLALRRLARMDRIIAVSESTARDVQRLADVPRRQITIIPEAISDAFRPAGLGESVDGPGSLRSYEDLTCLRSARSIPASVSHWSQVLCGGF